MPGCYTHTHTHIHIAGPTALALYSLRLFVFCSLHHRLWPIISHYLQAPFPPPCLRKRMLFSLGVHDFKKKNDAAEDSVHSSTCEGNSVCGLVQLVYGTLID